LLNRNIKKIENINLAWSYIYFASPFYLQFDSNKKVLNRTQA